MQVGLKSLGHVGTRRDERCCEMAQCCRNYLVLIKPLIYYTLALKRGNRFGLITCCHTGKKNECEDEGKKNNLTQDEVKGERTVQWWYYSWKEMLPNSICDNGIFCNVVKYRPTSDERKWAVRNKSMSVALHKSRVNKHLSERFHKDTWFTPEYL